MENILRSEMLWVDACGTERCAPSHQFGPAVRSYYLIHYIFSGQGEYWINEKRYTLHAGQGFIIFPDVITTYRADEKNPWHYGWFGYSGKEAYRLTRLSGFTLEHPIFSSDASEEIFNIISSAERDVVQLQTGALSATGSLLRFLSRIAQPSDEASQSVSPTEAYFRKATWYIEGNLANDISVTDVAAFVGLCRSQLFRIFSSEANCGPQKWILQARMRRAAHLLRESSLTLDEIARSCGFSCAAQLGQSFRKFYGCSPTRYRKLSVERSSVESVCCK